MNCDRIATVYGLLEHAVFGRALERRRLAFVEEISAATKVLALGDGDGRFTAEFCRRSTAERIDSVDSSREMLRLASDRTGADQRLRFIHGDACAVKLDGPYDLVITHFFLDCFTDEELRPLVARIAEQAAPNARWVVSEFCACNKPSALLIRLMYWFFRWTTGLRVARLPAYAESHESSGFMLTTRRTALGGLLVSELYSYRKANIGSTLVARRAGM